MTAGVILAAGAARRFGSAKQLATYEGEPLVVRACRTALAARLHPVVVVVGAAGPAVADAVAALPVVTVVNDRWDEGMSTSLRAGADYVDAHTDHDLAVLLADQPLIPASHIRALCDLRREADALVAATMYRGVRGAPAVFDRSLLVALRSLRGDRGAGALIRDGERVVSLPLADAAVDIDAPADLSRLARS